MIKSTLKFRDRNREKEGRVEAGGSVSLSSSLSHELTKLSNLRARQLRRISHN